MSWLQMVLSSAADTRAPQNETPEMWRLRAKIDRLERENSALRAYAFEMASAMRIAGDSGSASGEALARAECAQLRLVIAKLNADIASAWAKNGGAT